MGGLQFFGKNVNILSFAVSIPRTVVGGLQLIQPEKENSVIKRFNTEDGRGRAAIFSSLNLEAI